MALRCVAARFGEACGKCTFKTCSRRNYKETHRLQRLNIPSYWHSSVVFDQEPRLLTGFQTHRSCDSTGTKTEDTGTALSTHTGQQCELTCAPHTDWAHLQFLPVACASSPSAADFPATRSQEFCCKTVPIKANATLSGGATAVCAVRAALGEFVNLSTRVLDYWGFLQSKAVQ